MRSERSRISSAAWGVLALTALLPLTACGDDDPTGPGAQQGTMEAVVRDGGSEQAPAGVPSSQQESEVNGEFQGQIRVEVRVDGAWQTVSGLSNVNVNAELQGTESAAGSASVQARTYERVRIIVSNASADVEAGSMIGLGPIEVDVTVTIAGGGDVVIEYNQPVTVQAQGTTRLVLDLNSEAWLTGNAVQAGAVTSAAFQSAASVLVQ
jgi:hypothetical protein